MGNVICNLLSNQPQCVMNLRITIDLNQIPQGIQLDSWFRALFFVKIKLIRFVTTHY